MIMLSPFFLLKNQKEKVIVAFLFFSPHRVCGFCGDKSIPCSALLTTISQMHSCCKRCYCGRGEIIKNYFGEFL